MTRNLLALVFLFVPLACSSSKKEGAGDEDPYPDRASFCAAWAQGACNATVVSACSAADAAACVTAQTDFCKEIVPSAGFSSQNAQVCLDAVAAAYSDARLTAAERDTVRSLAAPCNQLAAGTSAEGESCDEDTDCDTVHAYACVIPAGKVSGSCYVPDVVGGGHSCDKPQAVCEAAFYCDGNNCLAGGEQGDACSKEKPCLDDYLCTGATGSEKCVAKADSGACTKDSDCKSDICTIASGTTEGICVKEIILNGLDPVCPDLS